MLLCAGCNGARGKPGPGPEVVRPEQVLDFDTLYATNCTSCHGANGKGSAAIALANPVYLAVAGEANLHDATAMGVKGTLMPTFARSAGGMLTDAQIDVLVHGMMARWGGAALTGAPGYKATLSGDVAHGQQEFVTFCASCHGADGKGVAGKTGSIVDPAYLELISDQALRSFVIAGQPGQGMGDWRSDAATPMSDQQITDVVVWLAAQRTSNPGQPYPAQR
jgi:mono/diheme cytochrome c family protein